MQGEYLHMTEFVCNNKAVTQVPHSVGEYREYVW